MLMMMTKEKNRLTKFNSIIKKVESEFDIEYNEEQLNAIKSSLENNISIITGGPGTGKTTIIKGIVRIYAYLPQLEEQQKE